MFPSNISELTNKLWRASLNLNFPLVLELFCQTEVDQFDIHTIPGNAHDIFGLKLEDKHLQHTENIFLRVIFWIGNITFV